FGIVDDLGDLPQQAGMAQVVEGRAVARHPPRTRPPTDHRPHPLPRWHGPWPRPPPDWRGQRSLQATGPSGQHLRLSASPLAPVAPGGPPAPSRTGPAAMPEAVALASRLGLGRAPSPDTTGV